MSDAKLARRMGVPVMLAACMLVAGGCATSKTGYKQAEKTGDTMAGLRKDLLEVEKAIENTTRAMSLFTQASETDLRKSYGQFSKAVTGLDTADEKIRQRADELREEGKLYVQHWEEDINSTQNKEVKDLAQARKSQVEASFRRISQVTVQMKDDLKPWISDVRDIHKYLRNDLTAAGVQGITPMIARTSSKVTRVRESLQKLTEELNAVESALTPPKPARSAKAS